MPRHQSSFAAHPRASINDKPGTPRHYRVLMHNDDYTTMEFVVEVLQQVFHHPLTRANRIMLEIHITGQGACGVFPYEIAETKVDLVERRARAVGFPLKCSLEEV